MYGLNHPRPSINRIIYIYLIYNLSALTVLHYNVVCQQSSEFANNSISADVVQAPTQDTISVNLSVGPYKIVDGVNLVGTGADITANATVDPKYMNSTTFNWSTKDGPIKADPHATSVTVKFDKPEENNFIKVDVTHYKVNTTTDATGSARFDFLTKSPVSVLDPVGKLFLEHGELLNINLTFKGSPPFEYCYKFCHEGSLVPCDVCIPWDSSISGHTSNLYVPVKQYLHQVKNYTLMFNIRNVMNSEMKHYTIKITDTPRHQSLPFAPIVSSILAVCILLSGVALHLHFRRTVDAETADFNFIGQQDDEEWEQEQSFLERVRYFFGCEQTDEMTESQLLVGDRSRANGSYMAI